MKKERGDGDGYHEDYEYDNGRGGDDEDDTLKHLFTRRSIISYTLKIFHYPLASSLMGSPQN